MKKIYLLAVLAVSCFSALYAQQTPPCATPAGKSDWLIHYQRHKAAFPRTVDTLYVPMTIHLLGDDSGAGYFPLIKVLDAVCSLNEDFAPSGIRFYIEGDIHYVNNSAYYNHEQFGPGYDMMQEHNVEHTINCYFVTNPAGACGYSIYGLGVALGHNCMAAGDNTWAHEMGHAFSLPHTFLGWEGVNHPPSMPAPNEVDGVPVERVSGANCEDAGDGFCDTPADYLNDRWTCNEENFSTTRQTDPDSMHFRSDGSFFMSYSLDICASRFSDEQIAAMRANITDERADFLYDQTPAYPVPDSIGTLSPASGETVTTSIAVLLKWEPTPNATHYFVQVSPLPSFGGLVYTGIVEGNELALNDLQPGHKYYWRIRPFNKVYACTKFSATANFTMSTVTNTSELESSLSQIRVFPNPVSSGQNIRVEFDLAADDLLDVRVVNVLGVTVWEKVVDARTGANRFDLTGLSQAGVYTLAIQGSGKNNRIVRPLIVME